MVAILDADVLRMASDLPDAADMIDRVQNEITSYLMRNHAFPKYLYINDRTWALCMLGLLSWTESMEVIATKYQHPRVVFVKGKRYSYREIAEESQRLIEDEEESIARGLLQIL